MRRVCINNQKGYCKLTVGKEYGVVDCLPEHYLVVNDDLIVQKYEKKKFVTAEQYETLQDKKLNPELYYSPVIINLNLLCAKIEMEVLSMDDRLRGAGDLFKFIGKENPCKLKLISEYSSNLDKRYIGLRGRKLKQDCNISSIYFPTNTQAIEYLIEVNKVIKVFNEALADIKVKNTQVYQIEHIPGGKLYSFVSDEALSIGETVICDTYKGQVYGVIKNVKTVLGNTIYKKCWRN